MSWITRASEQPPCFVHEIPYNVRRKLCTILDGNKWDVLAGAVGIDTDNIALWNQQLRGGNSATEKTLQEWSHLNPTISSLFEHLYNLGLVRAMHCIKHLVPDELRYRLLPDEAAQDRAAAQSSIPSRVGSSHSITDNRRVGTVCDESQIPIPDFRDFKVQNTGPQRPNVPRQHEIPPDPKELQNHNSYVYDNVSFNKNMAVGGNKPMKKICDHCSVEPPPSLMVHRLQRTHSQGPIEGSAEGDQPVKLKQRVTLPEEPLKEDKPSSFHVDFESDISNNLKLKDATEDLDELKKEHPNILQKEHSLEENIGSNLMKVSCSDIKIGTSNFDPRMVLGEGAFGKVYLAEMHGAKFAVKVINKEKMRENEGLPTEHHIKEKLALDRYRHPNIVQLCSYCFDGEQPCLVFEYMENGNLAQRIACKDGSPPIPWQFRHSIACNVTAALVYLHCAGDTATIHGDIKTPNILLNRNWEAKLSDFGLAQQASTGTVSGQYSSATVTAFNGEMKYGSYEYIPDEVWSSQGHVSKRTDVFSLGVVMLELLTGQKPSTPGRQPDLLRLYVQAVEKAEGAEGLKKLRDPLMPQWPFELWSAMMELALSCIKQKMKARPIIEKVSETLTEMKTAIEEQGLALWPTNMPTCLLNVGMDKTIQDLRWEKYSMDEEMKKLWITPGEHTRTDPSSEDPCQNAEGIDMSIPSPVPAVRIIEPRFSSQESSASQDQSSSSLGGNQYKMKSGPTSLPVSGNLMVQHPPVGRSRSASEPWSVPKLNQVFYDILNEHKQGRDPEDVRRKAQEALQNCPVFKEQLPPEIRERFTLIEVLAYPKPMSSKPGTCTEEFQNANNQMRESLKAHVNDSFQSGVNIPDFAELGVGGSQPGNGPVPDLHISPACPNVGTTVTPSGVGVYMSSSVQQQPSRTTVTGAGSSASSSTADSPPPSLGQGDDCLPRGADGISGSASVQEIKQLVKMKKRKDPSALFG